MHTYVVQYIYTYVCFAYQPLITFVLLFLVSITSPLCSFTRATLTDDVPMSMPRTKLFLAIWACNNSFIIVFFSHKKGLKVSSYLLRPLFICHFLPTEFITEKKSQLSSETWYDIGGDVWNDEIERRCIWGNKKYNRSPIVLPLI